MRGLLLALTAALGSLALIAWIMGPHWSALVAKPAAPQSLLLAPGSDDRHDPTRRYAAALIDRQIQPFLAKARAGDTVVLPPGRYTDCAVVALTRLTIAAERAGTAQFDGGVCEGKAAIVARGESLVLEGLAFRNLRAADANGAGVRLEHGTLTVRNSAFYNNQAGIITNAGADIELKIERSVFVRNGRCDGSLDCGHSVYASQIARLAVDDSFFLVAAGGHFIKSRALRNELQRNTLDDTDGVASQLLELPNGGAGTIRGNTLTKGAASSSRRSFIRIAAEGRIHDSSALTVQDNHAISHVPLTVFLWNDSKDPIALGPIKREGWILRSWGATR